MNQEDSKLYKEFQKSPLKFIDWAWGLTPERDNLKFVKGKHLTWQQHDILLTVENALKKGQIKRISISSGHGIGKSTTLAWLIIWHLFCFEDSQVPCTAPSFDQMHDVLWREVANWLHKMHPQVQSSFDLTGGYLRMKESPETWFARAKTARKEAPEALAGVHAEHVMFLIDEASGIPEEIFNTAEGALTGENVLVIMISNPTRLTGYFHESHTRDKKSWQTLQFSSEDSPIVDLEYINRIEDKHGKESDEYRIRVKGLFPKEDTIDEKGYIPLVFHNQITQITDNYEFRAITAFGKKLGIDPAGEGKDKTVWILRDNFVVKKLAEEKVSNEKTIAQKTVTLMTHFGLTMKDVYVDGFGIGAKVAQEISFVLKDSSERVNIVMTSDKPNDEMYLNVRAESAFNLRDWIMKGGQFVQNKCWEEILAIKYKRNLAGKIQIMPKDEMRKLIGKSPDYFDALCTTFTHREIAKRKVKQYKPRYDGYSLKKSNNVMMNRYTSDF